MEEWTDKEMDRQMDYLARGNNVCPPVLPLLGGTCRVSESIRCLTTHDNHMTTDNIILT